MSTFTSRLQLEKPAPSDSMADGASTLAESYQKIDAAAGVITCTSTTKPLTPYTGQIIWESDTKTYKYWIGSKWAFWFNPDTGRTAIRINQDSTGLTTTAEALFRSHTFTASTNRRYRIDYAFFAEHTANVNARCRTRMRWAVGASVSTAGSLFWDEITRVNSIGTTGRLIRGFCELLYTGPSQQITIGMFVDSALDTQEINVGSNTDALDVTANFAIRDWGGA